MMSPCAVGSYFTDSVVGLEEMFQLCRSEELERLVPDKSCAFRGVLEYWGNALAQIGIDSGDARF